MWGKFLTATLYGAIIMDEERFWKLVRRALLMIVRAIEERYHIGHSGEKLASPK